MELMKERIRTIGPLIHYGEDPEEILQHYAGRLTDVGLMSQDSTLAYVNGPEEIFKYYGKKTEKKRSKGRNKKRKYNGKSKKKKKRSKKTTGDANGDSTRSDSLREQLPGGDVSQREHALEPSAKQLPGQYSILELLKFYHVYEAEQLHIDARQKKKIPLEFSSC